MSHKTLTGPLGDLIAYRAQAGDPNRDGPGILWLNGFNSSMDGTKTSAVAEWAGTRGIACTRFDYSGHGHSKGDLRDGTIGGWLSEVHLILDQVATGEQIVIGSSMGGWLALLAATALVRDGDARCCGLVLIAPAVDMTERLMWPSFDAAARADIENKGVYMRPSAYDDGPYPITKKLLEEGRNHLLLDTAIDPGCPVRILQGMADPDVPWRHALTVVDQLTTADVVLTLIGDGDHRLSRPADIERLLVMIAELT